MSLTVKQINQTSVSLGKQTKAIQEKIHEHAIVISQHIAEHGDVSLADVLVNALGKSIRSNALRQWFLDFGGCVWNDQKKHFGKRKDFTFDLEAATANPFYDHVPEAAFKPVDGMQLLASALKKMKSALEDTENASKHKIDKNMIRGLECLLNGDFQFEDEGEAELSDETDDAAA